MQIEDNAYLQPSVSEQLGKEHQVVVVHPHHIVLFYVRYYALQERFVGRHERLVVLVSCEHVLVYVLVLMCV